MMQHMQTQTFSLIRLMFTQSKQRVLLASIYDRAAYG